MNPIGFFVIQGKLINDSRNGDIFLSNMTLVISQTSRKTMGNYTCIAGNRQGESASAPLQLNIKCNISDNVIISDALFVH